MQTMKKVLSFFLVFVLLFSSVLFNSFAEIDFSSNVFSTTAKAAALGTCGENLTWTLDDEGTLTISGTGDMTQYANRNYVPWRNYVREIVSIVIEEGVTSVGSYSFYYADNLPSVSLPDTVTEIGDYAFYGCDSLASVTFSENLKTIGNSAFASCNVLSAIDVPESVTEIGRNAFNWCSELSSIELPDGLTTLGQNAFYYTAYYENQSNWQNDMLYIGNYLVDVQYTGTGVYEIKNGTTLIAAAFPYEAKIIAVPVSVIGMNDTAFHEECIIGYNGTQSQWEALTEGSSLVYGEIIFDFDKNYALQNGMLYKIEKGNATLVYGTVSDDIIIPEKVNGATVISIAEGAFVGEAENYWLEYDKINTVTFPSGLKTIEANAFVNVKMYGLIFKGIVQTIGENAFASCDKLEYVYIPDGENSYSTINIAPGNDCLVKNVFYEEYPFEKITMTHNYSIPLGYFTEYVNDSRDNSFECYKLSPYYVTITRTFKDGTTDIITGDNALSFRYDATQLKVDEITEGEKTIAAYYFEQPVSLTLNFADTGEIDAETITIDETVHEYAWTDESIVINDETIKKIEVLNSIFIYYCESGNIYTKTADADEATLFDISALIGETDSETASLDIEITECGDEILVTFSKRSYETYKYEYTYFMTCKFDSFTEIQVTDNTNPAKFFKVGDIYVYAFMSDWDYYIPDEPRIYYTSTDLKNWTERKTPVFEYEIAETCYSAFSRNNWLIPGDNGLYVLIQGEQSNPEGAINYGYFLQGLYYTENFEDYILVTEGFAPYSNIIPCNRNNNELSFFSFETYHEVTNIGKGDIYLSRMNVWKFNEDTHTVTHLFETNTPATQYNAFGLNNFVFFTTTINDTYYNCRVFNDQYNFIENDDLIRNNANSVIYTNEKHCMVDVYIQNDGSLLVSADGLHLIKVALPDDIEISGYLGGNRLDRNGDGLYDSWVLTFGDKAIAFDFDLDTLLEDGIEHQPDVSGKCLHCGAVFNIPYRTADTDGDGQITAADARLALRASVGLETLSEEQILAADVNNDGEVTSADARFILRLSVGLETL